MISTLSFGGRRRRNYNFDRKKKSVSCSMVLFNQKQNNRDVQFNGTRSRTTFSIETKKNQLTFRYALTGTAKFRNGNSARRRILMWLQAPKRRKTP